MNQSNCIKIESGISRANMPTTCCLKLECKPLNTESVTVILSNEEKLSQYLTNCYLVEKSIEIFHPTYFPYWYFVHPC